MTKIFVIDDEESVVRLLMEYFNHFGYDCEGYFFDKDLMSSIRYFMPDIIVCDLNLETTTGLSILAEIKQNIDLANISFVFLTGSTDDVMIQKGFELGADDCLKKPVDLSEIKSQVDHILNRKQSLFCNKLNTLIIDQNEKRIEVIEKVFTSKDNNVLSCSMLKDAEQLINNNEIDIIIATTMFVDGDIISFFNTSDHDFSNVYFALIVNSKEIDFIRKARKSGFDDFIYMNYGDIYFRGKLAQIIRENNVSSLRHVYSLKEKNIDSVLSSFRKNAFTGEIEVVSKNGNGNIFMNNGEYESVTFNNNNEPNALELISSLTEGEMIIKNFK